MKKNDSGSGAKPVTASDRGVKLINEMIRPFRFNI